MSILTLVQQCAPTLAGLKVGSLFSSKFHDLKQLQQTLAEQNAALNPKGIYIVFLRVFNGRALIYVYRKRQLAALLADEAVQQFLAQYGYDSTCIEGCLALLKNHLAQEDFPHEIGVFLGYPISDIIGFVENKGQNFKCLGCWKVYDNEVEAKKLFARFKKCTDVYCKKVVQGFDITRLTVAG